jgi:hypothetical protein
LTPARATPTIAAGLTPQAPILNPPENGRKICIFVIAAAAALVSFGMVLRTDIQKRFFSLHSDNAAAGMAVIDQKLSDAAQGEGLYLQFKGFAISRDLLCDFPSQVYARGVFTLYPNRVLVGDPAKPVASGEDLVAGNFDPDPAWLNQYRIHGILRYTWDNNLGSYSTYTWRIVGSPQSTK